MDTRVPIVQSTVRNTVLSHAHEVPTQSRTFELTRLWPGLCSGAYHMRDYFSSADRHYVVVEWLPPPKRARLLLAERRLDALEQWMTGQQQKVVAAGMVKSSSTVSTDLQTALLYLGCQLPASRVPLVLVMAEYAHSHAERNFDARYTELVMESQVLHVISTERPELRLRGELSRTELMVLELFVEGNSYREIAAARGTSIRTVANQVASIFGRLKVSGRGEVLRYIVAREGSKRARAAAGQ